MRSALVTHDRGYQRALKFPYMVESDWFQVNLTEHL